MPRTAITAITAITANPFDGYSPDKEHSVRISRSKARAAGPDDVQFYAPGWRPMVFRSMEAAERKLASHPGFIRWER